MMQDEGAVHVTTERSVFAAMRIGLDHVPAGPAVVVVAGRMVVVDALDDAPDDVGFWLLLHPAARNVSATAASAVAYTLPRCGTRSGRGGRSPRGRDDATTYRGR
jgi:hypothetical protein